MPSLSLLLLGLTPLVYAGLRESVPFFAVSDPPSLGDDALPQGKVGDGLKRLHEQLRRGSFFTEKFGKEPVRFPFPREEGEDASITPEDPWGITLATVLDALAKGKQISVTKHSQEGNEKNLLPHPVDLGPEAFATDDSYVFRLTPTLEAATEITEHLQSWLGGFVWINMYASGAKSTALSPHTDEYDTWILHAEGRKAWDICIPRVPEGTLPPEAAAIFTSADRSELKETLIGQQRGCSNYDIEECKQEMDCSMVILEPGDMLYIPKGVVHQAREMDGGVSVHLTLAFPRKGITFRDLVSQVVVEKMKQILNIGHAADFQWDKAMKGAMDKVEASWAGLGWRRSVPLWMAEDCPDCPICQYYGLLIDDLQWGLKSYYKDLMKRGTLVSPSFFSSQAIGVLDALKNPEDCSESLKRLIDTRGETADPQTFTTSLTTMSRQLLSGETPKGPDCRGSCDSSCDVACDAACGCCNKYGNYLSCNSCCVSSCDMGCNNGCDDYCGCNSVPKKLSNGVWTNQQEIDKTLQSKNYLQVETKIWLGCASGLVLPDSSDSYLQCTNDRWSGRHECVPLEQECRMRDKAVVWHLDDHRRACKFPCWWKRCFRYYKLCEWKWHDGTSGTTGCRVDTRRCDDTPKRVKMGRETRKKCPAVPYTETLDGLNGMDHTQWRTHHQVMDAFIEDMEEDSGEEADFYEYDSTESDSIGDEEFESDSNDDTTDQDFLQGIQTGAAAATPVRLLYSLCLPLADLVATVLAA